MFGGLRGRLRSRDRRVQKEAINEAGLRRDASVVPDIIPLLNDRELMRDAIWALGQLRDPRAIAPLIAVLRRRDKEPGRDGDIRIALREIDHGPVATPLLVAALSDPDADVRRNVVDLIGDLGDSGCTPALIAAASDSNEAVAFNALYALAAVGDPRGFSTLASGLSRHPISEPLLRGMLRMGGRDAIPHIVRYLSSPDIQTLRDAASVLREANWSTPDKSTAALYLLGLEDWRGLLELGSAAIKPLLDFCILESRPERSGKNVNARAVEVLTALNWSPMTASERAMWAMAQGDYEAAAQEGVEAMPVLLRAWRSFSDANAVRTAIEQVLASHARELADATLLSVVNAPERSSFYQQSRNTEEFASSPETIRYTINDQDMKRMAHAELARRGKA